MRGKGNADSVTVFSGRITPAYAGKSLIQTRVDLSVQDHPRLCGEKKRVYLSILNIIGSPPPMRGKEFRMLR